MTRGPVAALPAGRNRSELIAEVTHALTHLPADAAVVLACSGGPDSTALAYLVAEAREDLERTVVHVGHGLRGVEVEAEERELVARHAAWTGSTFRSRAVQVPPGSGGPEAAARSVRYAALRAEAVERGAVAILLGHTADDQAETVLLRVARGTGTDGLAGMQPVQGDLLRPLLRLRRSDIHAFVADDGLVAAHDASNDDPRVRRTVVRHRVLPDLAHVAPDPVGALTRLALLAHDDAAALAAAAAAAVPLVHLGEVSVLQRPALRRAHPALARRRVRDALAHHLAVRPSAATVARVLAAEPGDRVALPGGVLLEVTRAVLVLAVRAAPPPPSRTLDAPGFTVWPELGAGLLLRTAPAGGGAADAATGATDAATGASDAEAPGASDADVPAAGGDQLPLGLTAPWSPPPLPADLLLVPTGGRRERVQLVLPALTATLTARPPRPGDRIRTAAGTRRVAVVLRDGRLPRLLRARWPVVVMGEQVLWIPGFAVDADAAAAGRREPTVAVALLRSPTDPHARG